MDDSTLVLEKHRESVKNKWTDQHRLRDFSPAERAVWLVLEIRTSSDLDGFSSVFEQTLTRSEIIEAISLFKQLRVAEIADDIQQALTLLDTHCDYSHTENVILGAWQVCEQIIDEIDNIGNRISSNAVWGANIEAKLADMIRLES